jgi:hypothetical protein
MPPRRRRSSGVDTIDDIHQKISQQQAAFIREFGSLEICIYLYNQWQSKAPPKADNAKRGYHARKSLLNLQNKLNQRIREEDKEANQRNEALGNLSPQSIWADPIRLPCGDMGSASSQSQNFPCAWRLAPGAAYSDL